MSSRRLEVVLLIATLFWCAFVDASFAQSGRTGNRTLQLVRNKHQMEFDAYAASMFELADWCEARQFNAAARNIRGVATPVDTTQLRSAELTRELRPTLAPTLPPLEREWRTRFRKIENAYARELYKLSRQALRDGSPSLAMQLVREVVCPYFESEGMPAQAREHRHGTVHREGDCLLEYSKYHSYFIVDPASFGWNLSSGAFVRGSRGRELKTRGQHQPK